MRIPLLPIRRLTRRTTATIAACSALALGLTSYGLASGASAAPRYTGTFTFKLIASPGIAKCLPKARGQAWITPHSLNDTMKVQLWGMPANAQFDLFVIQTPNKPFGVSWYQSDIHAGGNGSGSQSCYRNDSNLPVPSTIAPVSSGTLVVGTICDSPAAGASIVAGSVITSVNGQAVGAPDSLHTQIAKYRPGNTVSVTWVSPSGQRKTASVTLTAGPPQ